MAQFLEVTTALSLSKHVDKYASNESVLYKGHLSTRMSFTLYSKGHIVCAGPERAGGRNSPKVFIQKEKSKPPKNYFLFFIFPPKDLRNIGQWAVESV